jgi:hypothetical protein
MLAQPKAATPLLDVFIKIFLAMIITLALLTLVTHSMAVLTQQLIAIPMTLA